MTTLVWSRKGACVKVRDAAAPRAPPFVALSARRAGLLEWKEGRVHQEDVSEEGRMAEREAEADAESQSVHCSAAWHARGRHPEWVVQKIFFLQR